MLRPTPTPPPPATNARPEPAAGPGMRAVLLATTGADCGLFGLFGACDMPTEAKTPARLGREGRALWQQIIGSYALRVDEVVLLANACREIDLIERLEVEQRDQPLTVRGAQGQLVASPLGSELRQHRT